MNKIKLLFASLILMFATSVAKAEDDVKLRLNWMYYGFHIQS